VKKVAGEGHQRRKGSREALLSKEEGTGQHSISRLATTREHVEQE
jgi:hypothetical protein